MLNACSLSRLLKIAYLLVFVSTASERVFAQDETFRIGVILCLTGDCAEWGQNSLHALEIAAGEIDAAGGVLGKKIELIVQDSREMESGANSVSAFQKILLDGKTKYFIGPTWTIGGLPLAPIAAKRADIIITSPTLGVATFNETADNIFNTWPHDHFSTEALAAYAIRKGWKRAAVMSNQNPWESVQAKSFVTAFKRLGGEIVEFVEPLPTVLDLKAEALRVKNAKPDVVFLSNYTQMDIAAKEFSRLKYVPNKIAILMDETRLKNSAGGLEGTIFARYPDPAAELVTKFEARFKTKPGIGADTAYDTLYIYKAAIESAKTFDTTKVKGEILKLKHVGASGEIQFDEKGGVLKTPEFWIVKNGAQTFLEKNE